VSSVEPSPWLSDGLYRAAAAVASAQQSADYLEQLLPSLHLDQFSSLPSLPAPNRLSVAEATHEHQAAMVTAHQRVLNVWEQATTVRRKRAMQELDQWLCSLPALWRKTLLTCSPTDVISFMERSWLAKHGGTVLPDGTTVASPSGVNVCLSSLSTGFSLLGRVGSWSPVTPQGNPIQSAGLLHWHKGYRL